MTKFVDKTQKESDPKARAKQLSDELNVPVIGVKTRAGLYMFIRMIPTGQSHREFVRSSLKQDDTYRAMTNYVCANVVDPTAQDARRALDEEPWHYMAIFDRLMAGIQTEIIDPKEED